jgi:hypothetical protein
MNNKPTRMIRLSAIYESHIQSYLKSPGRQLVIREKHIKAINKTMRCRTSTLGVAVYGCEDCGDTVKIYRSCKHRFCSRCGAGDTLKWAESTLRSLMNIKHHHVIVTLPKSLRYISKLNENRIHNLLFREGAAAIQNWFKEKYNLRCGIVSVLHTAGSDLKHHPHIHMIVSAGGQDLSTGSFRVLKGNYLTRQRHFGQKICINSTKSLLKLYRKGDLQVSNRIKDEDDFKSWMSTANRKPWIVSIQPALEDINQIVGYVGRYTKRTCISEYKIEEANGTTIKFQYNDYKNTPRGEKPKIGVREMSNVEFLDKLLQHVPDSGYKMVRYYGMYNSLYKGEIPESMKFEGPLEENYLFDEDMDWGENERFRKSQIKRGNPDPLFCKCCQKSMKFQVYHYKKSFKAFEYDTS